MWQNLDQTCKYIQINFDPVTVVLYFYSADLCCFEYIYKLIYEGIKIWTFSFEFKPLS